MGDGEERASQEKRSRSHQHAPPESESATESIRIEINRRGETVLFIGPGAPYSKVDCLCKVIEIPPQQHHLTIVVKPSTEQPDEWTTKGCTFYVFSPGYPLSARDEPGKMEAEDDEAKVKQVVKPAMGMAFPQPHLPPRAGGTQMIGASGQREALEANE